MDNNRYNEEIEKVRTELLEREDQYITFRNLVERFDEIEKEYPVKQWNLLQIYSNFNILIGEKKIGVTDTATGQSEFTTSMEEAAKRGERI